MLSIRLTAPAEYRRSRQTLLAHSAIFGAAAWNAVLRTGALLGGELLSLGGFRLNAVTVMGGNGSDAYAFGSDDPIGKLNRCWSGGSRQPQGRKRT
ncbi:MAG: hypothetical protein KC496_17025 [Anaerolineae bacterium]|nr:hypothetical protein [Anaerolineae bacterium]